MECTREETAQSHPLCVNRHTGMTRTALCIQDRHREQAGPERNLLANIQFAIQDFGQAASSLVSAPRGNVQSLRDSD